MRFSDKYYGSDEYYFFLDLYFWVCTNTQISGVVRKQLQHSASKWKQNPSLLITPHALTSVIRGCLDSEIHAR
jgi:hypothetical protein